MLDSALAARSQTTANLLNYLFDRYAACSDQAFVDCMYRQREEYEDGADIMPRMLMQKALNKYNLRMERGKWSKPSEADAKIIALQAKVAKLKKNKKAHQANGAGKTESKEGKKGWQEQTEMQAKA